VTLEPLISPPLVVLLVAAAYVLTLRARDGLVARALRLVALVLLAALLLNPVRVVESARERSDRLPVVSVLVDDSASMATADVGGRTRYDVARAALDETLLDALRAQAEVHVLRLSERLDSRAAPAGGAEPRAAASPLHEAVTSLVGSGCEHVVIVSDGAATDRGLHPDRAPALVGALQVRGVRAHVMPLGSPAPRPDLALMASPAAPLIYEGEGATLRVRLTQSGFDGRDVTLRTTGPGGVEDERVVRLAGGVTDVRVAVEPAPPASTDSSDPRSLRYVVEADPLEAEPDVANNAMPVFVRVTGRRIRVIVFEARPSWDTRFFLRAMRADPRIEVTAAFALGEVRGAAGTQPRFRVTRYTPEGGSGERATPLDAPPLAPVELGTFDVVVLGAGIERFFPSFDAEVLTSYVDAGGVVVLLRGEPVEGDGPAAARARQIVRQLAPVTWGEAATSGGRVVVEERGGTPLDLEVALADLPEVGVTREAGRRPLTRTLAVVSGARGGPDVERIAIATARVGSGRSLAVLSEGLWRWAFLPATSAAPDGIYDRLWSRLIRWLALGSGYSPGQAVTLNTPTSLLRPDEPLVIGVRSRAPRPDLRARLLIEGPMGDSLRGAVRLALIPDAERPDRRWTARAEDLAPGEYRVVLETPELEPTRQQLGLVVREDRVEFSNTAARHDDLAALARATGGLVLRPDSGLETLASHLDARRVSAQRPPTKDDVLHVWPIAAAFALLLLGHWTLVVIGKGGDS
jgi:hypothetical protein